MGIGTRGSTPYDRDMIRPLIAAWVGWTLWAPTVAAPGPSREEAPVMEVAVPEADAPEAPPAERTPEAGPAPEGDASVTEPEATPGEATPGEATPGEATPGEATPGEATPGEATPGYPPLPVVVPPAPDHVRVHPPRHRGTGLMVGAAVTIGLVGIYQAGDVMLCGGCAVGIIERLGLAASMAAASGGGVVRALHDSWYDTAYGRTRAPARRFVAAGAALVGVGAAVGLVNEALWWGCWIGGRGPYAFATVDEWGPWIDCHRSTALPLLDGASALVAGGGGLLAYGLTLRRRQAMLRNAKVIGLTPSMDVDRTGARLMIGGRF
jgi:hypothetical protein